MSEEKKFDPNEIDKEGKEDKYIASADFIPNYIQVTAKDYTELIQKNLHLDDKVGDLEKKLDLNKQEFRDYKNKNFQIFITICSALVILIGTYIIYKLF